MDGLIFNLKNVKDDNNSDGIIFREHNIKKDFKDKWLQIVRWIKVV
jgi:hypothetical protein